MTNHHKDDVIKEICNFMWSYMGVSANLHTPLLGKNATISSLSVMELVAWCEDEFGITEILEDDLFLDALTSIDTLATRIIEKGGSSNHDSSIS